MSEEDGQAGDMYATDGDIAHPPTTEVLDENADEAGLVITAEDMEVLDFINHQQMEYESKIEEKVRLEVIEKYGDRGTKIIEQLAANPLFSEEDDECTDCGDLPENWLEDVNKKMGFLDILLDTESDELVDSLIEQFDGSSISMAVVRERLAEKNNCKEIDIVEEELTLVCNKILFKGIEEGWLRDESGVFCE